MSEDDITVVLSELSSIFAQNYCKSSEFKKELSSMLFEKTGNDNLSEICREIIGI
jgi:hypothetical protein